MSTFGPLRVIVQYYLVLELHENKDVTLLAPKGYFVRVVRIVCM